jgi:arylformamidase
MTEKRGPSLFREYDQKALDDQYEQRVWAKNAEEIIARYAARSAEVRRRIGQPRIERYGSSTPETLDVYGSGKTAFVFVHGGAWKRQRSWDNAFAAEPIVAAGAAYVALNFALLPVVTLPEMADQVCRGVEWVRSNVANDVVLCGHSSGAHLGACALLRLGFVRKALLVSGIYDLLPVRLSARNDYVRLDERLEHEYSPIRHIERIRCPVTVGWGEKEGAEFYRQSKEFAEKLGAPAIIGAGLNHFEIAETLAESSSPLGRAALNMLQ